jgi:hypothetical protein
MVTIACGYQNSISSLCVIPPLGDQSIGITQSAEQNANKQPLSGGFQQGRGKARRPPVSFRNNIFETADNPHPPPVNIPQSRFQIIFIREARGATGDDTIDLDLRAEASGGLA